MALPNLKIIDRSCLALVIVAFLLSAFWQFNRGLKEEKLFLGEKDKLTRQAADKRLTEEDIEKMRSSVKSSADEVAKLNTQIPEDADIGTFLKQLAGFMNTRQVGLISVQPQQAVKEKLCLKIPVRVICRGPFVNLYGLLCDLDTMGRLVVVERMSLGKPGETGYCQLEMNLLVFARGSQSWKAT